MRTQTTRAPLPAFLIVSVAFALASPSPVGADEYELHKFTRTKLDDVFYCEGASFGDLTGDGVNELVSGPYWYRGPEFMERHEFYPPKPFDPKGYSNNFFVFVHDFNKDSKNDILVIGFPGQDASWFENPGAADSDSAKPTHWMRHVVFDTVDNESPTFGDLTGDGRPELIAQTGGRFGYAVPDWSHPEKKWRFVAISENRKLGRFTHGLGYGDVNGDGRKDVLERGGWFEQPASLEGEPLWKHHAFPFSGPGGAQMYTYDVDGDGDADVITSLAAHGFGLAWYEQIRENDQLTFRPHVIMPGPVPQREKWEGGAHAAALRPEFETNFSNLHAIDLVDMDGDGLEDIVTGKRFWAHFNEKESGGIAVSYWFRLTRDAGKVSWVPYMIDSDSGIGTQVVAGDVNGDGHPDVVVGNKKGTFYLEHRVEKVSREAWIAAQPKRVKKEAVFYKDALPPEKCAEIMTVPDGFQVELVAGEPDLHQPVAFTLGERGRLWVVEAYTYPKRVKGRDGKWNEGVDKVIVLEDSDGDGSFETRKVFVEGLNLVSGIAVGHGGVWIGAAPYLLFFADANGDDRADGDPEFLLDGFGFQDTHETLNSFIWGPDGWLYGCHGVFTHSRVGKPGTPDAERTPVNAAYWRYHPTRHEFDVFARGTSNPWGIDFNDLGQAFSTACVIPHLYHVIQGARYQRQGGRHFNPHIYDDIKTIADHRHYAGDIRDHAWWGHEPLAPKSTLDAGGGHAHCGAMIYLGNSFPPEYRDKLFMNNIHGNRVNCDILERRGSGYVGRHGKDLLLANHARYRGINLKYGPDGSVFIIDWHDKNACHRTLPEIWDRSNGRLYRLSYGAPKNGLVDLSKRSDAELVELQLNRNDWYVRVARRLLQERAASSGPNPAVHRALAKILRENPDVTRKLRALWALHVTGGITSELAMEQLSSKHEHVRGWTIQCALETGTASSALRARLAELAAKDPSPVVRLYLASALQRLPVAQRAPIAKGLVARAEDENDHNLPLLIWYGVEPIAAEHPDVAMELADVSRISTVTRFITRRIASNVANLEPIMTSLGKSDDAASQELVLSEMLEAFKAHADVAMPNGWERVYGKLVASSSKRVRELAQAVAVRLGDRRVFPLLRDILADRSAELERRRQVLGVLLGAKDKAVVPVLQKLIGERDLRRDALRALAAFDHRDTPKVILDRYTSFTTEERNDAINTLSSRAAYGTALIAAVERGAVPRKDLSAFTIRQLRILGDERLNELVNETWGVARETSADKLAEIARYKKLLRDVAGDPKLQNGRAIFARVCAQCHTLFGVGSNIAPDITGSNRANLDYILENLVDPNALVGKDYQMTLLLTRDGRAVTGLITQQTESAFTVKTINDEVVVAKRLIRSRQPSTNSLMPEGLLGELSPGDVRDLIAYLASPHQVFLPGASVKIDRKTHRVAGALEGETLARGKPTRGNAAPQAMQGFGVDKWSGNDHLWWTGARPGDKLDVYFDVEDSGVFAVDVALTKARDYGIVQLSLDGKKVESPIDLYDEHVVPTGTLRLGEIELSAGRHTLGVEIVGANPKAQKAFMFGLDYVLLGKLE